MVQPRGGTALGAPAVLEGEELLDVEIGRAARRRQSVRRQLRIAARGDRADVGLAPQPAPSATMIGPECHSDFCMVSSGVLPPAACL